MDDLYKKAVEFAKNNEYCGIAALQRHLKTGMDRTIEILDEMERNGIISPAPERKYCHANALLGEQLDTLRQIAVSEGGVYGVGYYDGITVDHGNHNKENISHGTIAFDHNCTNINICIINNEPLIDKVIILAHETGHALDFKNNWQSNYVIWSATNTTVWGKLPKEKDAWRIAIDLLQRVGFTEWDKCIEWVKKGMRSYFLALGMRFDDDHPFLTEIQNKINSKER
jgi:hypothetical protein